MSVLHYCLTDTRFQLDDVSACCEKSVGVVGGDVNGLTEFMQKAAFGFLFLQSAPGSFCRLHITVTQGSSPKELQPNQPLESKSGIARLTTLAYLRAMSSSPIPVPEPEPSIVKPP